MGNHFGSQIGDAAMGVGTGAATYELAKSDPSAYVGLMKLQTYVGIGVVILVLIIFLFAYFNSKKQDDLRK